MRFSFTRRGDHSSSVANQQAQQEIGLGTAQYLFPKPIASTVCDNPSVSDGGSEKDPVTETSESSLPFRWGNVTIARLLLGGLAGLVSAIITLYNGKSMDGAWGISMSLASFVCAYGLAVRRRFGLWLILALLAVESFNRIVSLLPKILKEPGDSIQLIAVIAGAALAIVLIYLAPQYVYFIKRRRLFQ